MQLATPPKEHFQFDWKEVDCFFRPQAVVCEQIGPDYGLLFLYLASFHNMFEFRGGLERAGDAYFENMKQVLAAIGGLEIHTTDVSSRSEIPSAIKKLLAERTPLILPVNIRSLPWYQKFQDSDQVHYLIVTGYDESEHMFGVLDNLHVNNDNESTTFAPVQITEEMLGGITGLYAETYLTVPSQNAIRPYWMMWIGAGSEFRLRSESEIFHLVLSEYLKPTLVLHTTTAGDSSLDSRYIARLRSAHDSSDKTEFHALSHSYLAASNFANVSLKILVNVVSQLASKTGVEASAHLDRYFNASSVLRSKLIVTCLISNQSISQEYWNETAAELTSLSDCLREKLANVIVDLV